MGHRHVVNLCQCASVYVGHGVKVNEQQWQVCKVTWQVGVNQFDVMEKLQETGGVTDGDNQGDK